jgi:uncharacterized protein with HEPN domain
MDSSIKTWLFDILKAIEEIENARNIVGTRNRIIHSYDSISDDMIWSIIINSLPKLKLEIVGLLENRD